MGDNPRCEYMVYTRMTMRIVRSHLYVQSIPYRNVQTATDDSICRRVSYNGISNADVVQPTEDIGSSPTTEFYPPVNPGRMPLQPTSGFLQQRMAGWACSWGKREISQVQCLVDHAGNKQHWTKTVSADVSEWGLE